jgi:uncharacterized protein (TIGR03435 family)
MLFRLIASIALGSCAFAQAPAPSFEVASVKPAAPCCAAGQWRGNQIGADRIDFQFATLRSCIAFAYGVKGYQVAGPAWLNDSHYDIVAKGPEGTRREQLPRMMQTLLAERFRLGVHSESREFPSLALVVGSHGPKLRESEVTAGEGLGGAHFGISASGAVMRLEAKGATMESLVNTLTSILGQPVVDKTGLTARYDLVLEYSLEDAVGFRPSADAAQLASTPAPEPSVSIYGTIQQYGLKLEARKLPLDVIVVDSAERTPVQN